MEEEKSVKLLTKKLAEHYGRTVVFNAAQQDRIQNTDFVYVAGDSKIIGYPLAYKKDISQGIFELGYNVVKEQSDRKSFEEILQKGCSEESNYLFVSPPLKLDDSHVYINVVPYAIIGKKECSVIKEKFYNSSDPAVREAIWSLEIEDFYRLSEKIESPREFLAFYKFVADLFQDSTLAEHMNRDHIGHYHLSKFSNMLKEDHNLGLINSLVGRLNIDCGIVDSGITVCTEYLGTFMTHLSQYSDFFKFAFNQPLEEQSIELNKFLLKHHTCLFNIDQAVIKEYSQGQSFKEYFEILGKSQKENVVRLLKYHQPKDPEYKSFLLNQRFKEIISLSDYKIWYETDPQKFIEYFQGEGEEKRAAILREIFESEFTNAEVIEWLNKNELEAIRKIGMF